MKHDAIPSCESTGVANTSEEGCAPSHRTEDHRQRSISAVSTAEPLISVPTSANPRTPAHHTHRSQNRNTHAARTATQHHSSLLLDHLAHSSLPRPRKPQPHARAPAEAQQQQPLDGVLEREHEVAEPLLDHHACTTLHGISAPRRVRAHSRHDAAAPSLSHAPDKAHLSDQDSDPWDLGSNLTDTRSELACSLP